MNQGLLFFTFSPVQSFIAESRKLSDLYTASRILSDLAQTVARVFSNPQKGRRLVFPSTVDGDLPNKLVAILPFEDCTSAANEARDAFHDHWTKLLDESRTSFLEKAGANARDGVWDQIWERQSAENYFWEIYWTAALINGSYQESYQRGELALEGIKRTRIFGPSMEAGEKDTFSGSREALHTDGLDSRRYWTKMVKQMRYGYLIQPGGRECLDSIGLVKRFCKQNSQNLPFSSTSSVASRCFLDKVQQEKQAIEKLVAFSKKLEILNCPSSKNRDVFNFDGDFLYPETLTPERLAEDYGLENIQADSLNSASKALKDLFASVSARPSSYYGILMLDGDSMGKALSECDSEEKHRQFSNCLNAFSKKAKEIFPKHLATGIYTGGDDVLAFAPLETTIPLAAELAEAFEKTTNGLTASAGIVFSHHRSPLAAALRAVRSAERCAKDVTGKSAVCVRILKRSGEEVELVSKWENLSSMQKKWVEFFINDQISTRMPYDLLNEARTLTLLGLDARKSGMRRVLNRHVKKVNASPIDLEGIATELATWAEKLDQVGLANSTEGLIRLGYWLTYFRFVSAGGEE